MVNKDFLVIDGALVARSPHTSMYLNILDRHNLSYDVFVWNRKGDVITDLPDNHIVYDHKTKDDYPAWKKLISIYKFYKFVKMRTETTKYKAVVIFDIANSFFFFKYLKNNYSNKYIYDIRDYSPLIRIKPARYVIKQLINNSYTTVISSNGFQKWLPPYSNYTISHNIDIDIFNSLISTPYKPISHIVEILTIGNLRDPEMNCLVAKSFANDQNFHMRFVGDGAALPKIQNFCKSQNISNVSYYGHYKKNEEVSFYQNSDIINCCMEDNMLSNYLMSNRIYLAALLQKPIICYDGSYQSYIIEKYHLGCVLRKGDDPHFSLKEYLQHFNIEEYLNGRKNFLDIVKSEQMSFENTLVKVLNKS